MIPRTPRSTRTDTLFPYTTLFRSFFRMSAAARSMDSSCEASKASRVRRLLPNCSDWVLRRLINGMFKGQQWRYTPLSVYRNRRSEEHTAELQSLMRISYAVFCLKKKRTTREYKYKRQTIVT